MKKFEIRSQNHVSLSTYLVNSLEVAVNDAEAALDAMKMLKDVASSVIEDQVSSDVSADGENTGISTSGKASMNEPATNDVDNKAKDSNDATAKGSIIYKGLLISFSPGSRSLL